MPSSSSVSRMCVNLVNSLKTSHLTPSSSSISRAYVNLINLLKTSHLIIPSRALHLSPASKFGQFLITSQLIIHSLLLHPFPESTWTCSIVWRPLIWSFLPLLFICLQQVRWFGQILKTSLISLFIPLQLVRELVNFLKTSHLIIPSYSLRLSPGSMWIWLIIWKPLIQSSFPFLFIRLQVVRELGQLFGDLSSDHPSSISRKYFNLVNYLKTSDHPILSSLPVCRTYVNWSIVRRPLIW